jgi:hypothetical protein
MVKGQESKVNLAVLPVQDSQDALLGTPIPLPDAVLLLPYKSSPVLILTTTIHQKHNYLCKHDIYHSLLSEIFS